MNKYQIAIYMRVSKEDAEQKKESDSITNQRRLLQQFVKENFIEYTLLEFCDDGYTGTNFLRPAVKELLEKVKKRQIHCIVVKDFSRFSRDYIELGAFLEQIFPFMHIRFVSINDHYDSQKNRGMTMDLGMEFQNLLYDLYSKDISQKVRASLDTKKEMGQYVGGLCPFGYQKSSEKKGEFLIVPKEAEIVRRIFAMAREGCTGVQIARCFNEEKVKTPLQFQQEKGKNMKKCKGEEYLWNDSYICQVLKNETYIGKSIQKKFRKKEVGGKTQINEKKEWCIISNHHEPIVDEETFRMVQKERKVYTKKSGKKSHIFVGKAVCGCCKRNLSYRNTKLPYFTCPNRYINGYKECIVRIDAEKLEKQVMEKLFLCIPYADEKRKFMQEMRRKIGEERKECKLEMLKISVSIKREQKKTMDAYQKYALKKTDFYENHKETIDNLEKCFRQLDNEEKGFQKELMLWENWGIDEERKFFEIMIEKYLKTFEVYGEQNLQILLK